MAENKPIASLSFRAFLGPDHFPLIAWPIEMEAIAALKKLRREWQNSYPILARILKKRLERRGRATKAKSALSPPLTIRRPQGRTKGYSPLFTEQSWAIAVLLNICKAKPVEILSVLGKDTSSDNPASFRWVKRRRIQGEKILNELIQKELSNFKRKLSRYPTKKLKAALLRMIDSSQFPS